MASASFVHGGVSHGNTSSLTVPFSSGTATAGDLLVARVLYPQAVQTPSITGWGPAVATIVLGSLTLALFTHTAAGGETGVTFSMGVAALCYGSIEDWIGGKAGTTTSGTFTTTSSTGPFGPTNTPVSAQAVPSMGFGITSGATLTISAPWTVAQESNKSIAYAYRSAPGAAASGTLTDNSSPLSAVWLNLWIEPAGGSANTAAISGTLGPLACAATTSAVLAAAIASSMGPNATAATLNAANDASVAGTIGPVASGGQVSGRQVIAASATFGPLSSNLIVTAIGGLNTASITGSYGALASTGSTASAAAVGATGAMGPLAARGVSGAQLAAAIAPSLGALDSAGQIASFGTVQVDATLGPLASAIVVKLIAATLPPNPCFYLAMPYRCWYAALPARTWYVAMPARSFYISECC